MQIMRVRAAQKHHAFELRVQKPLLCGIGSKGQLCCGKLRFRRDSTERRSDAVRVFIDMRGKRHAVKLFHERLHVVDADVCCGNEKLGNFADLLVVLI